MSTTRKSEEIKQAVREHYATAITQQTSCCSGSTPAGFDPKAAARFAKSAGYTQEELGQVPETVTSFGCGNPVNFAEVKSGEVVLDLGSGSGLDLILAAKKVGETGRVIGLDMTDEMISICRTNLKKAGVANAEVRQGEMEQMPVGDAEIDWIISNCVINLSPEKEKVFAESYRVLKPGGRMLISDIVTTDLPDQMREDMTAWVGCIAGAVEEQEYLQLVKNAGFVDVEIVDKMLYDGQQLVALVSDACGCGPTDSPVEKSLIDACAGKVASIKLSARKPS